MNNIPYIDILILAMVAIFIINKLRNTLGKKTGNEHDIANKFTRGKSDLKESSPDKVSKAKVDKINRKNQNIFFTRTLVYQVNFLRFTRLTPLSRLMPL